MKQTLAHTPLTAPMAAVFGGAFRRPGQIVRRPAPVVRLAVVWRAFKTWRSRRLAMRELRALPDSLLRDIGVERGAIHEAVFNSGARPANLRVSPASSASKTLLPPQTAAETKKAA